MTAGALSQSLMWRELLCRYQVTDIASSVYRDRFGCWGFLDLWRTEAPPFSAADIEFLGHIAGPVTTALRHGLARTFIPATGATRPGGPVVLLLSPGLVVRAQTPQTERYLRVLVPLSRRPGAGAGRAYNVAAQLLAAEAGVDDSPPARVHLADGRWLTLRAARMGDAGRHRRIATSRSASNPPRPATGCRCSRGRAG